MAISEESRWFILDLLDRESRTGISAIGCENPRQKRPFDASHTVPRHVIANWVWKCDSRWSGLPLGSLVDMGCGQGWREIVADYIDERDVLSGVNY